MRKTLAQSVLSFWFNSFLGPKWSLAAYQNKDLGLLAWEQPWDAKVLPLTMHFLCFYFAEGKDAELGKSPSPK